MKVLLTNLLSDLGRELDRAAIDEFTEIKTVVLHLDP